MNNKFLSFYFPKPWSLSVNLITLKLANFGL